MLPVVHFVVSILVALALEIRLKNKLIFILLLGVLGTLPDLDHLLPSYGGVGIFHNLIFLFMLPIAFLLMAFLVENTVNKGSSTFQRLFICVAVVLLVHFLLDITTGKTVSINISTSTQTFTLVSSPLLATDWGVVMETRDVVWILLIMVVAFGNMAQKILYKNAEEAESAEASVWTRRLDDLPLIISKPRPRTG